MPYCPKCDMEFIDGVTVCSDCGGPLVVSKKAFEASLAEQLSVQKAVDEYDDPFDGTYADDDAVPSAKPVRPPGSTYVKPSQKQEDLKSSASAFFLVGFILLFFSALVWNGIIKLPMETFTGYLTQGVITIMGLGCLYIGFFSKRAAKGLGSDIEKEEHQTEELTDWFLSTCTAEDLDRKLAEEFTDLTPEEKALKRLELISDLLVTNHDLPDPLYVDSLSEDIYEKLYENETASNL